MRNNKKILAAAALVAAASLGLSACSAGAGGSTAQSKDEKRDSAVIALTSPPTNLDFTTTAGSAIPQALMSNVYEGLVELDNKGAIQPLLAESWKLSDDRKSYTFKLRDNVTFSNGDPFTADDVKFSFERVKNDWVSSLKKKMDVVSDIQVLGEHEVKINLAQPSNAWLFDLATPVGAIFSPNGVDDLANKAVGTGPYTVEKWTPSESLTLATRKDYWGKKPGVQKVTLKYLADATAQTNALQTGDVDAIIDIQAPEMLKTFEADSKFKVVSGTSSGEMTLSLNNKAAPFNDVRVRQAVLYALDKQAIIDTAWSGYGTVVASFATPTDPYYEDLNKVYPHDPKKAKALLKEAGFANGLDITYTVPSQPYAKAVSEIVVAQLKEVGINAKIESAEFPAVWLDKVFKQHDYQMTTIVHTEARDILTVFNDPNYYIGYDNSKIADLAVQADQGSEKEYVADMKKIVGQIVDDAASGVLFLFPHIVVSNANLVGIPENAIVEALDLTDLHWK